MVIRRYWSGHVLLKVTLIVPFFKKCVESVGNSPQKQFPRKSENSTNSATFKSATISDTFKSSAPI